MFFVHCVLCSPLATLCGNHLIFNGKGCSQASFLTCVALWSSIGCVHFFVCSFASRLLVPFSFFSALLTVSSPPLHAQHVSTLPLGQHGFFPVHSHRHWFFPDHSVPCSSRSIPTVSSNTRSRAVRTTRVQSHTSRLSQRSSTVVVVVVQLRGILQSNKCRRSASPTHCWRRRHRALSPTWQS